LKPKIIALRIIRILNIVRFRGENRQIFIDSRRTIP
jgi:hypothetical protein